MVGEKALGHPALGLLCRITLGAGEVSEIKPTLVTLFMPTYVAAYKNMKAQKVKSTPFHFTKAKNPVVLLAMLNLTCLVNYNNKTFTPKKSCFLLSHTHTHAHKVSEYTTYSTMRGTKQNCFAIRESVPKNDHKHFLERSL